MLSELNAIVSSYGGMEVIRLVPIPVAHLYVTGCPKHILILTKGKNTSQTDIGFILRDLTLCHGVRDGLVGSTSSGICSFHPVCLPQPPFLKYLGLNLTSSGTESKA
jgi:hypothetical protein